MRLRADARNLTYVEFKGRHGSCELLLDQENRNALQPKFKEWLQIQNLSYSELIKQYGDACASYGISCEELAQETMAVDFNQLHLGQLNYFTFVERHGGLEQIQSSYAAAPYALIVLKEAFLRDLPSQGLGFLKASAKFQADIHWLQFDTRELLEALAGAACERILANSSGCTYPMIREDDGLLMINKIALSLPVRDKVKELYLSMPYVKMVGSDYEDDRRLLGITASDIEQTMVEDASKLSYPELVAKHSREGIRSSSLTRNHRQLLQNRLCAWLAAAPFEQLANYASELEFFQISYAQILQGRWANKTFAQIIEQDGNGFYTAFQKGWLDLSYWKPFLLDALAAGSMRNILSNYSELFRSKILLPEDGAPSFRKRVLSELAFITNFKEYMEVFGLLPIQLGLLKSSDLHLRGLVRKHLCSLGTPLLTDSPLIDELRPFITSEDFLSILEAITQRRLVEVEYARSKSGIESNLHNQLEALESAVMKATADLKRDYEQSEAKLKPTFARYDSMRAKIITLQEQVRQALNSISAQERKTGELQNNVQDVQARIVRCGEDLKLAQQNNALTRLQTELNELNQRLIEQRQKMPTGLQGIAARNKTIKEIESAIANRTKEHQRLEGLPLELERLKQEERRLLAQIEQQPARIADLRSNARDLEQQLGLAEREILPLQQAREMALVNLEHARTRLSRQTEIRLNEIGRQQRDQEVRHERIIKELDLRHQQNVRGLLGQLHAVLQFPFDRE